MGLILWLIRFRLVRGTWMGGGDGRVCRRMLVVLGFEVVGEEGYVGLGMREVICTKKAVGIEE
jgi:hypothetical protein